MDEKPQGCDAESFSGVLTVQARAGPVAFFDRFFGDGLGEESML